MEASQITTQPVTGAMDIRNDNPSERARHQIDLDIRRLEDSIRSLKSQRNTLSPISKLPAELLCTIFSFCATDRPDPYSPLSWVKVTHVSRHWREVALDYPSLWTNLVFTKPRWAEEMLRRSKMATLVITADVQPHFTTHQTFEAVRGALQHISRTRQLSLSSSNSLGTSSGLEFLLLSLSKDTSAPLLQSLSLTMMEQPLHSSRFFVIPEGFLSGGTPKLRRLKLIRCDFKWNSQFLGGLFHIKIHFMSQTARPTIHQLLDVLEKMPNLKSLDLCACLPSVGNAEPPNRVINFFDLKYINIANSSFLECFSLLRCISFPSTTAIRIYCNVVNPFSSVIAALRECKVLSTDGSRPIIRTLSVGSTALFSNIFINTWPKEKPDIHAANKPLMDIAFNWAHPQSRVILRDAIVDICTALRLSSLRTLHVDDTDSIDVQSWVATFGHLPKLKTVHVLGESAHTLVKALLVDQIPDGTGASIQHTSLNMTAPSPSVCFPRLRTLVIEFANFDGSEAEEFEEMDELTSCMIERYERGAEVRKVRLIDCIRLTADQVGDLKEIVSDVDWDGTVCGFTEEEEEDPEEDNSDDDYYGYHGGFYSWL